MLFEAIIRSLEVVSDVIEFGPTKAVQINTSFSPEAERATTRILGDLEKVDSMNITSHEDISLVKNKERENESVIDQEEEEMIKKAVTEKGYY